MPVWAIPIVIVVVLAVGLSANLGTPFLRSVAIGSVAIGVPILVLNGLIYPGAREVLVALGPLAITWEGLSFGLLVAGRLVAALGGVSAFALSTRPDDLMTSLVDRGASPSLAFAVLVAVQAIPRLGRRAARIVEGAGTRGLRTTGSIGVRGRALPPLATALAVDTLLDVRDRTLALESRGFSSGRRRTAYRRLSPARSDGLATWAAVALLAGLLGILGLRVLGLVTG